jgi:hypothetical protein
MMLAVTLSTRVLVLGATLLALVLVWQWPSRKEGFNYTYTESVDATKKRGYTSWGRRLDVAKLCNNQQCVFPERQ